MPRQQRKILFATHNVHKYKEIRMMLPEGFMLLNLNDISFKKELAEDGNTLEENALQKASLVFSETKISCFADDTGLEVEELDGMPGVYSARYAGDEKSAKANIEKLLHEMKDVKNRAARFRTVICLIISGSHYFFEGAVNGTITEMPEGNSGFGYDPVFIPAGYSQTFAEMNYDEKNRISHRGEAVRKMAEFLGNLKLEIRN